MLERTHAELETPLGVAEVKDIPGEISLGTAWLIDRTLALTAAHVPNAASTVRLDFRNGERITARVIGADGAYDVAMLRLDAPPNAAIQAIPLNDDGDQDVGEIMRACGYPKGWNHVYSVDAPLRSRAEGTGHARFMALGTDQSRDELRGMSGGPVLDAAGTAIGLIVHFPEQLDGIIHAARLADIWQALAAWREEQPGWQSAGRLSRELREKLLIWDRLALIGPLRNRSATDLNTVFVQQRFGTPITATGKKNVLGAGQSDLVPTKGGGLDLVLAQLRADRRDVVLRGDAGTGKSVLLRRLAAVLANEWLDHEQRQEFPMLVQASELVHRTVDSVLGDRPGLRVRAGRPYPILLVDGLDEIVDVTERRLVVERIRQRIADVRNLAAPTVRFVLASRPLAVLDEIPITDAVQYVVRTWSGAQIQAFAKRWFNDTARAERFLQALGTARLAELAAVPALATVAAVVFEQSADGTLPSSRGLLYDRFIEHALGSRDLPLQQRLAGACDTLYPGQGAAIATRLWSVRGQLVEALAVQAQRGEIPVMGAYGSAALGWFVRNDYLPVEEEFSFRRDEQLSLVEDFLMSTGILGPGPDGLAFVHNTVREALVARSIAKDLPTAADDAWTTIRRWTDTRWREIVLLTLARWSRQAPDLRALLWAELEPVMSSSYRGLQFVGTAIGEGVELEPAAEAAAIDALLNRVESWSPCAEVFSTFRSPNPVDVVRTLSRRPMFFEAILDRLRFECRCADKIWAFTELAFDVRETDGLRELLNGTPQVATAAAVVMARSGSAAEALPFLIDLLHTERDEDHLVAIASLVGDVADEATLVDLQAGEACPVKARCALAALSMHRFPAVGAATLDRLLPSLELDADDAGDGKLAEAIIRSEVMLKWKRAPLATIDVLLQTALRLEHPMPAVERTARAQAHDATEGATLDLAAQGEIDEAHAQAMSSVRIAGRILEVLIAQGANDEDLSLAQELAQDDRVEFGARLGLSRSLAIAGYDQGIQLLRATAQDDTKNSCEVALAFAAAGRRDDALAILGGLTVAGRDDSSTLGKAYYKLGETQRAVEIHTEAIRTGENDFAVRNLMEMGRARDLMEIASDRTIVASTRNFAVQCLGQLGDAEALLALGTQAGNRALAIAAARELKALGWHREANSITGQGNREMTVDAEAAAIRATVADNMTNVEDLAALHLETWDAELLEAFRLIAYRTDLSPESALALWKHQSEYLDFEQIAARMTVPRAATATLLELVPVAAAKGAFEPARTAMSLAVGRSDVMSHLEALKDAASAFAQVAAGHAAQYLQWLMSFRLELLEAAHWETRRPIAEAILAEDLPLLSKLELLAAWRRWYPDDERAAELIGNLFGSETPPTKLDRNAFDILNACCAAVIGGGKPTLAVDWLTAIATGALSPTWRDVTEALVAAGALADNGFVEQAMPFLLQLANDPSVDIANRMLAAWHIGEHDLDTAKPMLLELAISGASTEDEDVGARCDVLRALFFLGCYEDICRLAPTLWKRAEPDSEDRAVCERYWGRSRWALDAPAQDIS